MEGVSNARIHIHFNVHEPVELMDLTLSFGALAREYRKFLTDQAQKSSTKASDADVKLYITKIEKIVYSPSLEELLLF